MGPELSVISRAFTFDVPPEMVKHIVYQPYIKNKKMHQIDMWDGSGGDAILRNMEASLTARDIQGRRPGQLTTLEKVIKQLEHNGARKSRRR